MHARRLVVFAFFVLLVGVASSAFATIIRTAVSINGSDANPCSPALPCRNFGAALAQTSPGGEVIALDSGGFGPFTISQPVTVEAPPGVYAGITVPSGGTGVTVTATSGVVVIRGLSINGLAGSSNGIYSVFVQPELHIEGCVISGEGIGILDSGIDGALFIDHSVVRETTAIGVRITAISVTTRKEFIDNSRFQSNGIAGIYPDSFGDVTVRNSIAAGSTYGVLARTGATVALSQSVRMVVENCLVSGNENGVGAVGDAARIVVSGSVISRNNQGVISVNSGVVTSLGNNNIEDNTLPGSFTSTVTLH